MVASPARLVRWPWPVLLWAAVLGGLTSPAVLAQAAAAAVTVPIPRNLERIFAGGQPQTIADFKAMERHVRALVRQILPSVVSFGGSSGVIVQGGLVLSAGHCTKKPGKTVPLTLHDGRLIDGKTLGLSSYTDTGILQIVTAGDYPALEMGRSSDLRLGQWVVMLGHPGGRQDRPNAPLRFGRIIGLPSAHQRYLVTDCSMAAGDSGGPVFDMHGHVIGTNSRIDRNLEVNRHVPIGTFRREWEWLVAGQILNSRWPPVPGWLGLIGDRTAIGAMVAKVAKGSPAARAGVRVGDRILEYDDRKVRTARSIGLLARRFWPGDRVRITLSRGGKTMQLTAVVGRQPGDRRSGESGPATETSSGRASGRRR